MKLSSKYQTDHPAFAPRQANTSGLRQKSLQSGTVTLSRRLSSLLIQVGSTAILSRLLTPHDFGVVAMVTAITGFANLFRDLGLSTSTIQSRELSHEQASAFFWINSATGAVLAGLTIILAPVMADFYNTPSVQPIAFALAIPLLFNGISVQHTALMQRSMRFKELAYNSLYSDLVGVLVSIGWALWYPSPWSVVLGAIARNIASFILLCDTLRWIPGRSASFNVIRRSLLFGGQVTSYSVIIYVARNVDRILIGRFYTPELLAVFNRAYTLMELPISTLQTPLNTTAMPALSALQTQPERYRSFYRQYSAILAFASFPLVAFCALFSEEIVLLFLGAQWTASVPIFRILAITSFIAGVANLRNLVFLSSGQGSRYVRWGIVYATITATAFVIGLSWGIQGIAYAHCVVAYTVLIPSHIYAFKNTPLRIRDLFESIAAPFFCTLFTGAVTLLLVGILPEWNPFFRIFVGALVFGCLYLTSYLFHPNTRGVLNKMLHYIEESGIPRLVPSAGRLIHNIRTFLTRT